jgi:catechol 2,3-dioxygenase-like lactoylglutathione lyase family enzyme
MAITGVHALLYTPDAEADRAWLTDVLGLESVDAGGGWLIFALPPAELAVHPASSEGGEVELYRMCDDIESTMGELRDRGVAFDGSVADQLWGPRDEDRAARRRTPRVVRTAPCQPAVASLHAEQQGGEREREQSSASATVTAMAQSAEQPVPLQAP